MIIPVAPAKDEPITSDDSHMRALAEILGRMGGKI